MQKFVVYVIEDDASGRDSLGALFEAAGFTFVAFSTAEQFLEHFDPNNDHGCVVVDAQLPNMTGVALRHELLKLGSKISVVLISGHDREELGIAEDDDLIYFEKPFDGFELIRAVKEASSEE